VDEDHIDLSSLDVGKTTGTDYLTVKETNKKFKKKKEKKSVGQKRTRVEVEGDDEPALETKTFKRSI